MLRIFKNIHARWLLGKLKREAPRQPAGWEAVQRIALILNNRNNVNKSGIDRFVQETGKFVEVYYVETASRKASFGDWRCLTREHRTLLDAPTRNVLAELKSAEYDLVINAAADRYSAVLSAAIRAPLKCSTTGRFREADLVIMNTNGLGDYLSQVLRYIRMIRPR